MQNTNTKTTEEQLLEYINSFLFLESVMDNTRKKSFLLNFAEFARSCGRLEGIDQKAASWGVKLDQDMAAGVEGV